MALLSQIRGTVMALLVKLNRTGMAPLTEEERAMGILTQTKGTVAEGTTGAAGHNALTAGTATQPPTRYVSSTVISLPSTA